MKTFECAICARPTVALHRIPRKHWWQLRRRWVRLCQGHAEVAVREAWRQLGAEV